MNNNTMNICYYLLIVKDAGRIIYKSDNIKNAILASKQIIVGVNTCYYKYNSISFEAMNKTIKQLENAFFDVYRKRLFDYI